jgi:hypothetical protein
MGFEVLLITHYLIREILVNKVLDVHVRGVKIKLFQSRCNNASSIYIKKRLIEEYLCWYAHREPYIPHDTIIEMMVRSTSSSSNFHEVVDDNCNPYRNMVMDAMRINRGYASQCSIIDEESNADEARFLIF